MKTTKFVHLFFTLLLIPMLWGSQYISNKSALLINNPYVVLLCLFGIPIIYFIAWFMITIRVFKKNKKEDEDMGEGK